MKLLGESFATVALSDNTIQICSAVDEVGEGPAVDVERCHSLLYGSIEIAASGMNDAEVDVSVSDAHESVGRAVRAGMHLDGFPRVFFGAIVVFEPGVSSSGIEDPLGVVEHEVMVGAAGEWKFGEDVGSSGEGLVRFTAVANSG